MVEGVSERPVRSSLVSATSDQTMYWGTQKEFPKLFAQKCLKIKQELLYLHREKFCVMDIQEILESGLSNATIISRLKERSVSVPLWEKLIKDYEPTRHRIVGDRTGRKDKYRSDGIERASRIYIGMEKLLSSRYNEYTFSIPVKRVYTNLEDNSTRNDIANALEAIYKHARIDAVNLKRGLAYYAACEAFTIWYTVERPNTLYGFPSQYKLKCKTYSPMEGIRLYPIIDEMDDMLAMSFEYEKYVGNRYVTYFETYTADRHYLWQLSGEGVDGWQERLFESEETGEKVRGERISIQKIPGVYIYRPVPVYFGLTNLREEIEYTLSRNSDVLAYNSAPVLKISGEIIGDEHKGEARRAFRMENGGDVSYVSWSQSNEALKYHVDMLVKLFFMQAQMPDVSFDNLKGLGSIGYDARQTLFTDAHLRIGEEAGPWTEFLERECNVIKAFLKQMNVKWAEEIDNVDVEHIVTPYIQNDEKYEIEKWMKANGDKPLVGHMESIRKAGVSEDPETTFNEYQESKASSLEQQVQNLFGSGESAV